MSSIDQRIVEMQFDNKQFESGVQTSLKSLENLKKGLNLEKSARGLEKLKKAGKEFSLESIGSAVDSIGRKFSMMGVLGVTAMQRISNAAITTGKHLVSALTIDPVRSGLREYETQVNSIQTILSNTRSKGTTIDQVNDSLDELNAYADKTIYNFTEMTRNIGTFTAAGVDLNTSVSAIKGISNLAAVSGSTSAQASTAMYQLSQALAAGTIRLMDWNSLVNAGMGGEVLQEALKETARVHNIDIDSMINKQGSFRETLQEGWLTSQIMLETLQKFTGDLSKEQILSMGYTEEQAESILLLGKDANDAATKVKTFTQLIETLKEALASGWTQSWENIIGNFEEARELWTSVSDVLSNMINKSAEARNALLSAWKEQGGRIELLEGLKDIFIALGNVLTAVKEAMSDIFPPVTVDNLLAISRGVREFGANLRSLFDAKTIWTGQSKLVQYTTKKVNGLTQAYDDLKRGAKGDNVRQLQTQLQELGYDLGSYGVDGIMGPYTEAALKAFQEKMGIGITGVYDEATHKAMESLGFGEQTITGTRWEGIYVTQFSDALEKLKRIASGVFAVFRIGGKAIKFVGNVFGHLLRLAAPLGDALLTVASFFGDWLVSLERWIDDSGLFVVWMEKVETLLAPLESLFQSAADGILEFFGLGAKSNGVSGFSKMVSSIQSFITSLMEQLQNSEKIQNGLRIIRDVIDFFRDTMKSLFSGLPLGNGNGKTGDTIEERIDILGSIGTWLRNAWDKISSALEWVTSGVKRILDNVGGSGGLAGMILLIIGGSSIVKLGSIVGGFMKTLSDIASKVPKMLESVTDVVKTFTKKQKELNRKLKVKNITDTLKSISLAIGVIVAAILILGKMDPAVLKQGAIAVGVIMASLATMLGAIMLFTKFVPENVGDTMKNLSKFMIRFALGLFILSKVVSSMGKMDLGDFAKGFVGMIGIMASLALFARSLSKLNGANVSIKGIFALSLALVVLTGVIKLISMMDDRDYAKGIMGISGILFVLLVFMKAMNRIGGSSVAVKGLFSLSIAIIGLLAVMKLISGMHIGEYVKGLAGLAGILVTLKIFTKSMSKIANGNVSIKGLLGISVCVLALAGIMKLINTMSPGECIQGILGLAGIMLVLQMFIKSLKKVSGNISFSDISGLIVISAAIGVFIASVAILGNFTPETLIQGVLGLVGVCIAFRILLKNLHGINIKDGVGLLIGCIGLIGTIVAFSFALEKVKDIDPDVMTRFGIGLGGLMAGFGVFMKLMGSVGIKGVLTASLGLLAIAAVIGLVIAAFSGLREIPGFQDFMNGGAQSIGEMFGNLVGAFEAAKLTTMANGLSSLSGVSIDATGLENTLTCAQKIVDFAAGLPPVDIAKQIANCLFGSDLEQFSTGMEAFGKAASSLSTSMEGVEIDQAKVDQAVSAASAILTVANAVKPLTVGEVIASVIIGGSAFESFCNEMPLFAMNMLKVGLSLSFLPSNLEAKVTAATESAKQILALANAVQPLTIDDIIASVIIGGSSFERFCNEMPIFAKDIVKVGLWLSLLPSNLEANVTSATASAKQILALANAVQPLTIDDIIASVTIGGSSFETFCNEMPTFAKNIVKVGSWLSLLPSDLETKVTTATTAAEQIQTLAGKVEKIDIKDAIANSIAGETPFTTFCNNMGTFATSVTTMATQLESLSIGTLEADVGTATTAATAIAGFVSAVSGMDIETDKGAFLELFTGDSKIDTLLDKIPTFGTKLNAASKELSGLSAGTFAGDISVALRAVERLAGLFTFTFQTGSLYEEFDVWAMDEVIAAIQTLGDKVNEFSTSTSEVDITRFSSISTAIGTVVQSLSTAATADVGTSVESIKTFLNELQTLFSGENANGIDTSKWMDGLDAASITNKLSTFTTDISTALGGATESLSGYTDSFNTAGAGFASAISQGISGNVDTGGVISLCDSMLSTCETYTTQFKTTGYNFGKGLAQGLRNSRSLAVLSARYVAQQVVDKVKAVFDSHSPSRVAEGIGMFFDKGLANGLRNYSKVVTKSADGVARSTVQSAEGSLTSLASILSNGIDADPVVRPVVDLSNVSAGAKAIGGMIGGSRSISIGASIEKAHSAANSLSRIRNARQNGNTVDSVDNSRSMNSSVNLTGNNFYVRSDQDINDLASEIAALTRQQQRGLGAG